MNIPDRLSRLFDRRTQGIALAVALFGGALSSTAIAQGSNAPQALTNAGEVKGKLAQVDGVTLREFQGIPFAAPPVGKKRWQPPQPVEAWNGVRDASRFAARCMQLPLASDMVFRSNGMSEDCLYLNVWTPASAANAKLPVLVYFYGGGFQCGDGSEKRYDGASLAAKGVVTVTVNYRLGVFGFLALPALAAESPHHAAGNYGLLDQAAALRWVQSNIAQFGGDPSKITIGGESAGSISVNSLMASPLSKGRIAGAIGESGALINPISPHPLKQMQQNGTLFVKKAGADSLAALRAMSAEKLLQAAADKDSPDFGPDIDGYFLTESPEATFERGAQAHVPLLLGANSQEGFWSRLLDNQPPTPANYRKTLQRVFGAQAEQALTLYPGHTEDEVKSSGTALSGDGFIAHTTWRWMDLHRRTGSSPVYFYYFDRPRPLKRDDKPGASVDAGAVHSGEIEYALGNLDTNLVYAWTPADHETSRVMEGYFAQFIKTGNPNGAKLPMWAAVKDADGGLLRQTIDAHSRTEVDRGAARQAFLQKIFAAGPPPF
ncbi:carboxylesterase family protein [Rhodanobacter sp. L36]|uniref:carboxylesterase/lipase family protein n=1 Tax=Rhodanobacter sp. L36 TaxID=1747221 RepID=UPI00131D93B3|nr:carboxylesterase family protein [Rhodanobacter sp. L36]